MNKPGYEKKAKVLLEKVMDQFNAEDDLDSYTKVNILTGLAGAIIARIAVELGPDEALRTMKAALASLAEFAGAKLKLKDRMEGSHQ